MLQALLLSLRPALEAAQGTKHNRLLGSGSTVLEAPGSQLQIHLSWEPGPGGAGGGGGEFQGLPLQANSRAHSTGIKPSNKPALRPLTAYPTSHQKKSPRDL